MPERTQSKANASGVRKTDSITKVEKDKRTGAGVGRLSETTQKVTLKEGNRTNGKERGITPQKNEKGTNQNGGRAGNSSGKAANPRKPGQGAQRSKGSASKETVVEGKKPDQDTNKRNPSRESGRKGAVEPGIQKEGTQSSLAIEAVSRENGSEENEEGGQEAEAEAEAQDTGQNGDTSVEEESRDGEKPENKSSEQQRQQNEKEAPIKEKEFDIREFSCTVDELSAKFSEDRFTRVGDNYPADDLICLIREVNAAIDHYKHHTLSAQQQLEVLRDRMQIVRDNIHESVQTRAFEARQEQEPTVEQKELAAKLAKINADVAHANVELARLVRMSTETEGIAIEAAQSAAQAQEEAEQVKAEMEWRERKAAERKIEEERRAEEERKQKEREEKLAAEERRKQEQEWKRKENNADAYPVWENWPTHVLNLSDVGDNDSIGCILRADPAQFDPGRVTCSSVNQMESSFTFEQNEELVSPILSLEPQNPDEELQTVIVIAIPFVATRSSMLSREPVVKAEINGEWTEIATKEVSFDDYKEKRFAQAEISQFTNVAVVTRFKRDYVTLSHRTSKIVFSADQRISFTTPKHSFEKKELLMIQVQPVDSNSLNELKNRDKFMKGLLNSSPLVTTKWERTTFKHPLSITVPCPPNPAKAKKLAAMRAAKEAKMNQPVRQAAVPIDVQEKENNKRKKKQANEPEEEMVVRRKETRWYMGIYGGSDDDESDNLYVFHQFSSGRWALIPEVRIHQVKLDVLQFELEQPVERFVVLRTRTNVDEEMALTMATTLEAALAKRTVQVIMRQRIDDPCQAIAQVVTSSRVDRTIKQLEDDGYEDGPKISTDVTVCEGDIIEVGFRGNIHNKRNATLQIPFNSNMPTNMALGLAEVDRYLQRNFNVFRGFVQFFRKYPIIKKPDPRLKFQQKSDEDEVAPEPEPVQYHRELLTEIMVNIPKMHLPSSPVPARANFAIVSHSDPVNEDLVRHLAENLGDEWYKLAQNLNIRHSRLQSIIRNTQAQDETEDYAKFQMIMTWLKRAPKASNKADTLTMALSRTGRYDLADDVRMREREFNESHNQAQIST